MSYITTFPTPIRAKSTFKFVQAGGTLTLSPANPAADRTITVGDPGGNDSLAYLAATQTLSNKTLGSDLAFGGFKGTGAADPSGPQDLATKAYVDNVAQGLDGHEACRVATTGALASNTYSSGTKKITAAGNGALVLDGITMAVNDRVLVKNESTGSNNGIYTVFATGSGGAPWVLLRATDADTTAEYENAMYVFVGEGTVNAGTGWILTTPDTITLDTTALTWTQFSSAGAVTAGDGMTQVGNTLNVVGTSNRISVAADSIDISTSYVGQASITTLGTITSGTWTGTNIAVANGGTGSGTASGARSNLAAAPNTAQYFLNASNGELGSGVVLTNGTGIQSISAGTIQIDTAVVVTLTGTQTLTNKTLTAPVVLHSVIAKSANFTAGASEEVFNVTTSTGNIVANVPQAVAGNKGQRYSFRKMDSAVGTITITPASSNVNGLSTYVVDTQNDCVSIESDGSNWFTC